ncbi:hypothetical protein PaG_00277 [Moesziomyces aphidis]|uniref:Proteasome assembly chaperone 2 n=1 Tax=Moesziomyces aphidis TaxID=84754 RepID=W3VUN5_MOEAP|nr:hypothetical protein PaG_00277 [Moesziomyces aphidis]
MSTPFYTPLASVLPSFEGATLLIPAVSIGSVPQLAVDLLLHSADLGLAKVGRIDPSFCFPFAGPSDARDAAADDITTALEVFANEAGLVVIQQRAPVYKSRGTEYITALTKWISQAGFKQTLWISSIDAAARTDAEFETPILSIPPANPQTPLMKALATFPVFAPAGETIPVIPGSLLTRKLLQLDAELNLGTLLYFAAEGDTRPDANSLATTLLSLLSLPSSAPLQEPASWSALFGAPPNSSLYT